LYCNKPYNKPIRCGDYITSYIQINDKIFECKLDTSNLYLPTIVCTDHSDKLFNLYDSFQSISFRENIRNSIIDIYNIVNSGVPTDIDIHIRANVLMDLNNPIKENPEIVKHKHLKKFRYNNGRTNIEIAWNFLWPYQSY